MTDESQVTYLTEAQAAELTRLGRTRSMECGAMTATLRCAGCDGAAMDGGGMCQHDCHDEAGPDAEEDEGRAALMAMQSFDAHERAEYSEGWANGVRWAAAEADAQASWREPVYILDITDHLRLCASNPERRSVVARDQAPEGDGTGLPLEQLELNGTGEAFAAGKAEGIAEAGRLRSAKVDALTRAAYEDGKGDGRAEGRRQATEGLTLQHEDEQWSIWWHAPGGALNVSVPDESDVEPDEAAWEFQASHGGEVKRRRRVLLVGEWEPVVGHRYVPGQGVVCGGCAGTSGVMGPKPRWWTCGACDQHAPIGDIELIPGMAEQDGPDRA